MKNRRLSILLAFVLAGIICCTYFLFIRNEVISFLRGGENGLLAFITDLLYPRLHTELARLSPDFFLNKADQLVIRSCLCLLLVSFLFIWRYKRIIPETPLSKTNLSIIRVFFYGGLIWLGREMYIDLVSLNSLREFYKPIVFLQIFPLGIPGETGAVFFTAAFFVACLLCILDVKPVYSSLFAIVLFLFYQAFLYSFEKVEHGYATVTYTGLLMPFLLAESRKTMRERFYSFFLSLIILAVAGCYFLSGLEKLLSSGLAWFRPETLQAYLLMHRTEAGLWVSENKFLLYTLPAAALVFQVGFICSVWYPRTRSLFLVAGVLFHWGTVWLFGISSFLNPWLLPYIFFIDWNKIIQWSWGRIRRIKLAS